MMHNKTNKIAGMTLVEVVITAAIFLMVMLGVTAFISNVFSYNNSVSSSFTTVMDTETLLKTVAEEVRMISPGSDGSYPIQIAGTSTLMFFADTAGTGVKTRIRYTLSGTKLYRAALVPTGSPYTYTGVESTTTIINNVRNATSTSVFEYFDGTYDGNESPLAQPVSLAPIRMIRVNITLDTDPTKSPAPRTYSTLITLRNLKDNI